MSATTDELFTVTAPSSVTMVNTADYDVKIFVSSFRTRGTVPTTLGFSFATISKHAPRDIQFQITKNNTNQ